MKAELISEGLEVKVIREASGLYQVVRSRDSLAGHRFELRTNQLAAAALANDWRSEESDARFSHGGR